MPQTGIEPVLYHYNRILSPARLPVPPLRHKWDLQGSNLWPSACKADALPAELRSHIQLRYLIRYQRPRRDSNPWPPPWQGGALTNWATGPYIPWKLHTRYILILPLFLCDFNHFLALDFIFFNRKFNLTTFDWTTFRLRFSLQLRLVFIKSTGQTLDRLVTVSSIHCCTSTSALSTWYSFRGLTV